MFNGSLRTESSNSIYSTFYEKIRQVYLETIYRGCDVVAVVSIGFMESRSYLNCGVEQRMIVITVVSRLNAPDQIDLK